MCKYCNWEIGNSTKENLRENIQNLVWCEVSTSHPDEVFLKELTMNKDFLKSFYKSHMDYLIDRSTYENPGEYLEYWSILMEKLNCFEGDRVE
jgi:hypothetical protein